MVATPDDEFWGVVVLPTVATLEGDVEEPHAASTTLSGSARPLHFNLALTVSTYHKPPRLFRGHQLNPFGAREGHLSSC